MSKLKKPPRLLPEQTRRHHDDPLHHLARIRSRPRDHHLELGRGRLRARFFFNERKTRGAGIPTRHVARHVAARPLFRRRKRAHPLMRARHRIAMSFSATWADCGIDQAGLSPTPVGSRPQGRARRAVRLRGPIGSRSTPYPRGGRGRPRRRAR